MSKNHNDTWRRLLKGVLTLLLIMCVAPVVADRYRTLLNAKHLTLVTQDGSTYYYIVSDDDTPTLHRQGAFVVLERDTFLMSDIRSMRLQTIPRFVLDEDSTTFDKNYGVSKGLLALRRTMSAGQWTAVILPVELTGKQVRDAFGQEAVVAQVRGFKSGDNTTVEYETLDLNTPDVVMFANTHYIIRPSREPDLAEGETAPQFGNATPKGPLYLIPEVTLVKGQNIRNKVYRSDDRSQTISVRGTYTLKDGSSSTNRKLPPNIYQVNGDGEAVQATDSVTVKAFGTWFVNTSDEPLQLHIYIDGITDDGSHIEGLANTQHPTTNTIYDLRGRKIANRKSENSKLPKGIYIINGKKHVVH